MNKKKVANLCTKEYRFQFSTSFEDKYIIKLKEKRDMRYLKDLLITLIMEDCERRGI